MWFNSTQAVTKNPQAKQESALFARPTLQRGYGPGLYSLFLGVKSAGVFKAYPIAPAEATAFAGALLAPTMAFGALHDGLVAALPSCASPIGGMVKTPPLGAASGISFDEELGSVCGGRRGSLGTVAFPVDCGALALADTVIVSPLATTMAWPFSTTRSSPSFAVTVTSPSPIATSPSVLNPETGITDTSPTSPERT